MTSQSWTICPMVLLGTSFAVSTVMQSGCSKAFDTSIRFTRARGYGVRSALPYTMSSNWKSSGNLPVPSTFSATSTRGDRSPTRTSKPRDGTSSPVLKKRAAISIASMIFLYPVQRHKLPVIALAISSRVGSGFLSSSTLAAMTIPGVQYPHCTAPASPKA